MVNRRDNNQPKVSSLTQEKKSHPHTERTRPTRRGQKHDPNPGRKTHTTTNTVQETSKAVNTVEKGGQSSGGNTPVTGYGYSGGAIHGKTRHTRKTRPTGHAHAFRTRHAPGICGGHTTTILHVPVPDEDVGHVEEGSG